MLITTAADATIYRGVGPFFSQEEAYMVIDAVQGFEQEFFFKGKSAHNIDVIG